MTTSPPSTFAIWLWAVRPRTLPLAASAIVLGCGIAALQHSFSLPVLVLALITALLLQVLSNLANDYGDAAKGADTAERTGPLRVVGSGLASPSRMLVAVKLCAALATGVGVVLVVYATWGDPARFGGFLVLGIVCVLAAMGYTMGKHPYGYRGWGDLMAGLFFGPVAVLGSASLSGAELTFISWLPALAAGFCSTAVLNINNMRDSTTDQLAGKLTVAVRLGTSGAAHYHVFLTFGTVLCWGLFWLLTTPTNLWALILLAPLVHSARLAVIRNTDAGCLNAQLRQTVLSSALLNTGMGLLCLWIA